MGIAKDVLNLGRWVYTVNDMHLIIGFIFLIDIFGDSYTYIAVEKIPETWIGQLFNNGHYLSTVGVSLSCVMLIVVSVNFILIYIMISGGKRNIFFMRRSCFFDLAH